MSIHGPIKSQWVWCQASTRHNNRDNLYDLV
jgi:hypothetical protein